MSCPLVSQTQKILIEKESLPHRIYQADQIVEKFNCSFNLNERFRARFEESGLKCVGNNQDDEVRIVELPDHSFFMAMLFQPQLSSDKYSPHPVIVSFLKAGRQSCLPGG